MIKTIIWDLDGTILKSLDINVGILQQVFPRHGRPALSRHEITKHYHGTMEETIRGLAPDAADGEVKVLLADFLVLDNAYIKNPNDFIFDDAARLVRRAHAAGIAQIIVTNRAHGVDRFNASPRTFVENSMLAGLIEAVICGDDAQHRKPKAEVLGDRVESFDPETTLVVGDQFVDGVFAHNLGARAVLVNRGKDPILHLEQLPDNWEERTTLVGSLDEVKIVQK
jgi:phosphoglycolate phosphatase-like HAD superfamily hydrolase